MKRILVIGLLLAWVAVAQGEQRVALVIGNGAYDDAPLKNPPNDARAIAQALRECDFEVIEKINSNQRSMEDAIRHFGQQIQRGGVGLFYYAGHGMQVQDINYLIPVGAEVKAEDEVKYEAVDAGRVLSKMESAGNRLNIIILDACRNNPFARSFRSADRGLKKMDAPKGSLLAYATAPGDVAADGDGQNGLYTSNLLLHMKTPGLPVEQVFKRVRADVMRTTDDSQVPWESTSLRGEFFFVPGSAGEQTAVLDTTYANGDRYIGEDEDGKKNGQGTYYWANGSRYVGQWLHDRKNGQGTYYWASGARYEGQFRDNRMNGQGTKYYTDGSKYVGQFKNNKMNGQGTFYRANGTVEKIGRWENGKYMGK